MLNQKHEDTNNTPSTPSRIKSIQHNLITLLTFQFQRLHVLILLHRSARLVRRGRGRGVTRPPPQRPQARTPRAGLVRGGRENLDLAEQRRQGRQRGGGESEADFDRRPGGDGLEGVKVLGVVEDAVGVGDADDGGDRGTGNASVVNLGVESAKGTHIDPSAMTAHTETFLRVSIFVFHTNDAGRSGSIQSAKTFRNADM